MKKIIAFLFVALVAGVWTSCKGDDETTAAGFSIVETQANFDATGGEGYILASASGFSAVSSETWCHVSIAGTMINLEVDPFSDVQARSATVTVTGGGKSYPVPVYQMAALVTFPSEVVFVRYPVGSKTVDISANTGYTVSIPTEYQSWLSYSLSGDQLILEAKDNPGVLPRTAPVIFTRGNGVTGTMTVVQEGLPDAELYDLLIDDNWTASGKLVADDIEYTYSLPGISWTQKTAKKEYNCDFLAQMYEGDVSLEDKMLTIQYAGRGVVNMYAQTIYPLYHPVAGVLTGYWTAYSDKGSLYPSSGMLCWTAKLAVDANNNLVVDFKDAGQWSFGSVDAMTIFFPYGGGWYLFVSEFYYGMTFTKPLS